jgi:glycosyltransferase involved in cell wall biosynthesis
MLSTLTVFTPTYNRAHTLPRLFQSLREQTSRDFTWLVLDDGSDDDTQAVVSEFQKTAGFTIDYVYQKNQGKHEAINVGVGRARTELFLIVDSDDELLPHAVELIATEWRKIPREKRARFAGVWTLCETATGETLTGPLAHDVLDASLQELRYIYKIEKDLLRCFATEVLRRFPFPATNDGCPYIPEGYVWYRITRYYSIRFLNVACSRVYPQPDGLIANARDEYRLSRCVVYAYLQPLDSDLEWFWHEPAYFLMSAVQTARYSFFSGEFWRHMKTLGWTAKALILASAPVALLVLARDWASGRIARQMAVAGEGGPRQ